MGWVDWLLRPFRGSPPQDPSEDPKTSSGGATAPSEGAPAPAPAKPKARSKDRPSRSDSLPERPREKKKKRKGHKHGLLAAPATEVRAVTVKAPPVTAPEPVVPADAEPPPLPAARPAVTPEPVVSPAPTAKQPERDPAADEARRAEAAENRRRARLPEFQALLSRTDALLAVPDVELSHLRSARRQLVDGWARLGKPPREAIDALTVERDARIVSLDERIGAAQAVAAAEEASKLAQRWAVVVGARALAERDDLKGAGPAMGALRARLRAIGRVEPGEVTAVAFAEAEARLKQRQEQFRAERDAARSEQLERLEELVRRAEALAVSADPEAAAERVKGLQATWKGVRVPGPRAEVDAAWNRFRAACDAVFAARTVARARAGEVTLARMEAVVVRMEAMVEDGTPGDLDDEIAKAMVAWRKAGRAPREAQQVLWERLQRAFDLLRAPPVELATQDDASLQFRPFEGLVGDEKPTPAEE